VSEKSTPQWKIHVWFIVYFGWDCSFHKICSLIWKMITRLFVVWLCVLILWLCLFCMSVLNLWWIVPCYIKSCHVLMLIDLWLVVFNYHTVESLEWLVVFNYHTVGLLEWLVVFNYHTTITMLDYFPHMSVFHQERTGFDHHWTRILCIYSAGGSLSFSLSVFLYIWEP
jgi:hypothetical protein